MSNIVIALHVALAVWGVYVCVVLLRLAHTLYTNAELADAQPAQMSSRRRYRQPPCEAIVACFSLAVGAFVIGLSEAGWALARASGRLSWRSEIVDEVVAGRLAMALVLFGLYFYHRSERRLWQSPPQRIRRDSAANMVQT